MTPTHKFLPHDTAPAALGSLSPIFAMAIGFLYRDRPLDQIEWYVVLGAMVLVASYPFVRTLPLFGGSYPVGLIASRGIGMLVLRRFAVGRLVLSDSSHDAQVLVACVDTLVVSG
jgi:hypothetical protein